MGSVKFLIRAVKIFLKKNFRVAFYTNWIYKEYLFFVLYACYNELNLSFVVSIIAVVPLIAAHG
jgi:hypothetical protein